MTEISCPETACRFNLDRACQASRIDIKPSGMCPWFWETHLQRQERQVEQIRLMETLG